MEFRFIDPATDFSNGLQVIQNYHDDFLNRGKALITLVDTLRLEGMSETLANQCINSHCHYTHACLLHHQDEEKGLFPLIVNQSPLIDGMLERLTLDHEEIEEEWEALGSRLSQPEHIRDFGELQTLARAFEKVLREHLTRENEDFLPQINALLTPEQRLESGEIMQQLRIGAATQMDSKPSDP